MTSQPSLGRRRLDRLSSREGMSTWTALQAQMKRVATQVEMMSNVPRQFELGFQAAVGSWRGVVQTMDDMLGNIRLIFGDDRGEERTAVLLAVWGAVTPLSLQSLW